MSAPEDCQGIAQELGIRREQVAATAALLAEGATVPFIARYRKERTGSLDEIQVAAIRDQLARRAELDKRREAVIATLRERELLSGELESALRAAANLAAVEDLYLPHRLKRQTRGVVAKERGLEPLARTILAQDPRREPRPEQFLAPEKGVTTLEEALAGARDIIAEWVSEDPLTRAALRRQFERASLITSKVVKKKEEEGSKFRDYFSWQEPAAKAPGHRLLALFRGEEEKVLHLTIRPEPEAPLEYLRKRYVRGVTAAGLQAGMAVEDSYKRLLAPSLENELRQRLRAQAGEEAIKVFAANLRELLLAPPLGPKRVMALDPGFRTGAKLVCLDEQGQLLHTATIYPVLGEKQSLEAGQVVVSLCRQHRIEAIAIGNGTAGRETEAFVRGLELPPGVAVTMADESGASIYSASETARREFPGLDLTVRGAISIGRRLQDPLAELVKLEPKSIGVGQYQHDVDQADLKKCLADVVVSCVNRVGVEVNSASPELLAHVSGLGPGLSRNIVQYRQENGPFRSRSQLLAVPRLGAKAYEQAAGFLRVRAAENPLDRSGVHPERYGLVAEMARDAGCTVAELLDSASCRQRLELNRYLGPEVGLPTLHDIAAELAKPGRDPRPPFSGFAFAPGVKTIDDLVAGMILPGVVTNVTKFGAFVDLGVHQDGLIHISQLADGYVKDPAAVVRVRQQLMVRVLEVDRPRKRIALSRRGLD